MWTLVRWSSLRKNHDVAGRLILLIAGILAATLAVLTVQASDGLTFADPTPLGLALFCLPGAAAITAGASIGYPRTLEQTGPLLGLVGIAWFISEWAGPGSPSAMVFTTGLALNSMTAAVVAHLLLRLPGGRLPPARGGVTVAGYLILIGWLGIVPSLFFSPSSHGCGSCPPNLLLVSDNPSLVTTILRISAWAAWLWSIATIAVLLSQVVRQLPIRHLRSGYGAIATSLAGIGLLGATGLGLAPVLVLDGYRRTLWIAEGTFLALLAAAIAFKAAQAVHARRRLVRQILLLDDPTRRGADLESAIGGWLGDPTLSIGYPIGNDRCVDARGRAVTSSRTDHRARTWLQHDGEPLAVLAHSPWLQLPPYRVDELLSATRLALVNQRLQAQRAAQLAELRAARLRLVEAADEQRRRLERDLHDGAQQRLVSLALALRDPLRVDPTGHAAAAADGVGRVTAEIRKIARGIYPSGLSQGLTRALSGLSESTALTISGVPSGRLPRAIETTVYQIAAWAAAAGATRVDLSTSDADTLTVQLRFGALLEQAPGLPTSLADRLAAVGGELSASRDPANVQTLVLPLPNSDP